MRSAGDRHLNFVRHLAGGHPLRPSALIKSIGLYAHSSAVRLNSNAVRLTLKRRTAYVVCTFQTIEQPQYMCTLNHHENHLNYSFIVKQQYINVYYDN